jgi:two-component system, cell cycle response regulator DivK
MDNFAPASLPPESNREPDDLPASKSPNTKSFDKDDVVSTQDAAAAGDKKPPLVLVVEDEIDLLQVLCLLLETRCHCRVLPAETGAEAVYLARRHRPDLILLDLILPDINGWEVARLMREDPNLAATPIVAVSEHCWEMELRQRAEAAGCSDCVHKSRIVDTLPQVYAQYVKSGD